MKTRILSAVVIVLFTITNFFALKAQTGKVTTVHNAPLSPVEITLEYQSNVKKDTTNFYGNYSIKSQPDTTSTAIEDIAAIPYKYELEQNYPNPFNPSTRIKTTVLKPSKFIIYNILGQIIASLDLEPGEYIIEWSPRVAAGIYFYRIFNNEFSLTKKAILLDGGNGSGLRIISESRLPLGIPRSMPKSVSNNAIIKAKPLGINALMHGKNTIEKTIENFNPENDYEINFDFSPYFEGVVIEGKAIDVDKNPVSELDIIIKNEQGKTHNKTDENGNAYVPFIKTDSALVTASDSLTNWYNTTDEITIDGNEEIEIFPMIERRTYKETVLNYINGMPTVPGIEVDADFLDYFKLMTETDDPSYPHTKRWLTLEEYKKYFGEPQTLIDSLGILPLKIWYNEEGDGVLEYKKLPKEVADSCRASVNHLKKIEIKIEETPLSSDYEKVLNNSSVYLFYGKLETAGNTILSDKKYITIDGIEYMIPQRAKTTLSNNPAVKDNIWQVFLHELLHTLYAHKRNTHSPYIGHIMFGPKETNELAPLEKDAIILLYDLPIFTDMSKINNDTTLVKIFYE